MEDTTGIQDVIRLAGGQSAFARDEGVTQAAVWKWLKQGFIPSRRAVGVEARYGIPRGRLIDPRLLDITGAGE